MGPSTRGCASMSDWMAWAGLRGKPLGLLGGVLLLAMIALAVLADRVAPYDYDEVDIFSRLKPSSGTHWLGTDNLGRDLLSRIVYGARVSMAVGFGAVLLGLAGGGLGLVAAVWGRNILWAFRPQVAGLTLIEPQLDWRVLVFTLAVALATGLVFGLAPAVSASRTGIVEALKEDTRTAGRSRRIQ